MQITATILEISETQQVTDTFRKRDLIVEYAENPQYPEFIKFELIQDKCDILDNFKTGQTVDVHFNLKGRKWTNPQGEVKYFNQLQAWKVFAANGDTAGPAQTAPPADTSGGDEDDLPF